MSVETSMRDENRGSTRPGQRVQRNGWVTHHATWLEVGRRGVAVRLWLLCSLQLAASV